MEVKTAAQLGKIADLCRKKGIESIKITAESVEFKLIDEIRVNRKQRKPKKFDLEDGIQLENQPTEEEVLFWSTGAIGDEPTTGQG